MSNIYVIMGTTGEYSDRIEWPVIAFEDENEAKQWIRDCDIWYRREVSKQSGSFEWKGPENPFDPNMEYDYTGTRWYYMTVPMDKPVKFKKGAWEWYNE